MYMWNRVNWADVDVYIHSVRDELMDCKLRVILDSYQLSHDLCLYYET